MFMSTDERVAARTMAAADKVRRPRAATAGTRERIVDAAITVFADRGYHKGSLLEIADRAGMSHAGVLHYFGSKDNLLTAVLASRDASGVAGCEGQRRPTGRALLDHLESTARDNATRPGIVQAYAVLSVESVTEDHPAQEFFRERFSGLRAIIVDALREEVPLTVPEEELTRAASGIIAVMDGLQVQWLLDPEVIDMATGVQRVIDGTIEQLRRSAQ